jgi:uncharacterized iron-regulated membrane protein
LYKNKISRWIFKIHGISGLIFGLFLLIISLSGSLLVFSPEINQIQLENKVLSKNLLDKDSLWKFPFDASLAELEIQKPGFRVAAFYPLFQYGKSPIIARMVGQSPDEKIHFVLDPKTGKATFAFDSLFTQWLLKLHYTIFNTKSGEFLVALVAIALIISSFSGIWVYRKNIVKTFRFQFLIQKRNLRTLVSGYHRFLGVWALVFNLVFAISGFLMMRSVFDWEHWQDENPSKKIFRTCKLPSVSVPLKALKTQVPGLNLTYLSIPVENEYLVLGIYGDEPGRWWLGPAFEAEYHLEEAKFTLIKPEMQISWPETVELLLFTLHFGQYGGWWVKILVSVFGCFTSFLVVSGFFLFLKRKKLWI